jgi:hypothetical protein
MMVLIQVADEETGTGTIARMGSEALAALIQELGGRSGGDGVIQTQTTPTSFTSFNASTPFVTNGATTPMYEWYCSDGAFGMGSEYASPPADTKEDPRYNNMELQLPILMSYEDTKVGLMNCYESATRA